MMIQKTALGSNKSINKINQQNTTIALL